MARKKPRPYGTGAVVELKGGLAIRWWESVQGGDGVVRREMRYANLGDVSKRDAEARLGEKQLTARINGPQLDIPIPTFKELADRYTRDILPTYERVSTRIGQTTILKVHLIPRFGSQLVSELGPAVIQRFFTELREKGYERSGQVQAYAAHTLVDIRNVLRAVMKSSLAWYRQPVDALTRTPANPVQGIKLPRLKPKMKPWYLTADKAGQLIGALSGKSKAMVALAITAGLRRGEILALRIGDLAERIEPDGRRFGLVTVAQASYLGHIGPPKTEAGLRTVELHPWVLGLIKDWLVRAKKRNPDDFVFGTRTNRLENSNNILRRHVFPACDALGVEHATWLTFRRTFQTFAHNLGIPARTIADIVGHADVGTQHIYIQSEGAMKRVAADKIGNQLCEIVQNLEMERAQLHLALDTELVVEQRVN